MLHECLRSQELFLEADVQSVHLNHIHHLIFDVSIDPAFDSLKHAVNYSFTETFASVCVKDL